MVPREGSPWCAPKPFGAARSSLGAAVSSANTGDTVIAEAKQLSMPTTIPALALITASGIHPTVILPPCITYIISSVGAISMIIRLLCRSKTTLLCRIRLFLWFLLVPGLPVDCRNRNKKLYQKLAVGASAANLQQSLSFKL
jgi:hypothetical protein